MYCYSQIVKALDKYDTLGDAMIASRNLAQHRMDMYRLDLAERSNAMNETIREAQSGLNSTGTVGSTFKSGH